MRIFRRQYQIVFLFFLGWCGWGTSLRAENVTIPVETLVQAFNAMSNTLAQPQSDLTSASPRESKNCALLLKNYFFLANYTMYHLNSFMREVEKSSPQQNPFLQSVKKLYEKMHLLNASDKQRKIVEILYTSLKNKGFFLSQQDKAMFDNFSTKQYKLEEALKSKVNQMHRILLYQVENKNELQGLSAWPYFSIDKKIYVSDYHLIMRKASRPLRKKVYLAFKKNQQILENIGRLKELTRLRQKKAQLLGYHSYADMAASTNIFSTSDRANSFVTNLLNSLLVTVQKNESLVQQYAFEKDGITDLQPWDFQFYKIKAFEDKLGYSERNLETKLMPYLHVESVVQSLFQHAKALYGLTFVEHKDEEKPQNNTLTEYLNNLIASAAKRVQKALKPKQHRMKKYRVFNKQGQELPPVLLRLDSKENSTYAGWLLLGEENYKKGGDFNAARYEDKIIRILWTQSIYNDTIKDENTYLTLSEVETVFHEFGHVLNFLYLHNPYSSIDWGLNLNVAEVPSKFMENYTYEENSIRSYARHYKTNQPLSDELVLKIQQYAKSELRAFDAFLELILTKIDLDLHDTTAGQRGELQHNFLEELLLQSEHNWPSLELASLQWAVVWKVLIKSSSSTYAGNYHAYAWADVVSTDIFEDFKARGQLYNADQFDKFRQYVLSISPYDDAQAAYHMLLDRKVTTRTWLQKMNSN